LLSDGIIHGNLSHDAVYLYLYGHYLANGGNPDDFLRFTEDDLHIMYVVLESEKVRDMNTLLESLANMLGAERRN
jgi:hypothetical protein